MAAFRLCSKSTNVPSGHRRCRSSSRVTTSPGCSSMRRRISNGWSCRRTRRAPSRSSRDRQSSSNDANRRTSLLHRSSLNLEPGPGTRNRQTPLCRTRGRLRSDRSPCRSDKSPTCHLGSPADALRHLRRTSQWGLVSTPLTRITGAGHVLSPRSLDYRSVTSAAGVYRRVTSSAARSRGRNALDRNHGSRL